MNASEEFEDWLAGMDVLLEEFMADLPEDVSSKLDYSIESLDVLEAWLLETYPSIEALDADPSVTRWDAATRYYGQVVVKQLGGRWDVNPDGPPHIRDVGLGDEGPPFIPMFMVSTAIDRQEGHILREIAEATLQVQQGRG